MKTLKQQLKERSICNIGEVLQVLLQVFEQNNEAYNFTTHQTRRYNQYLNDRNNGVLSVEDAGVLLDRISIAVLDLIDQISDEEAVAYEIESAIFQKILVVCKSPERENDLRELFPTRYYKGVEYEISGQPRPASSVNKFDLIVFDNFPAGKQEDEHSLLRYYLDKTTPYLLYFGSLTLYWLSRDYGHKAYYANSVFSIHARLEEMVKYVKYTSK